MGDRTVRRRRVVLACTAGLLVALLVAVLAVRVGGHGGATGHRAHPHRSAPRTVPFGAFLGSGAGGAGRVAGFQQWVGAGPVTVGHTYLPGRTWRQIEGQERILAPWSRWVKARSGRMLVLNVAMSDRNEADLDDGQVRAVLRDGARGRFDGHYRTLARRLVRHGMGRAVLVLGWEMNGDTYSGRCAPDPEAWKTYWRRIVHVMRDVAGARFRFDFAPNRGPDAISWKRCWPGDDVADIVGMDNYDQPPGKSFSSYVDQPDGLQDQVDFAAAHHKPVSYPEWGLWRRGDDPDFVRAMLRWIESHTVAYQTVTDYCPHGVYGSGDWGCAGNPESARAYREEMRALARRARASASASARTGSHTDSRTRSAGTAVLWPAAAREVGAGRER